MNKRIKQWHYVYIQLTTTEKWNVLAAPSTQKCTCLKGTNFLEVAGILFKEIRCYVYFFSLPCKQAAKLSKIVNAREENNGAVLETPSQRLIAEKPFL